MTSKDVSEAMGFGPEAVGSRMSTYEYGRALCEAAAQDVATFLQNRRRVSQAEHYEQDEHGLCKVVETLDSSRAVIKSDRVRVVGSPQEGERVSTEERKT